MSDWLLSKAFGNIFHDVILKKNWGSSKTSSLIVIQIMFSSNLTFLLPYLKSVQLTFFKTSCYRDL